MNPAAALDTLSSVMSEIATLGLGVIVVALGVGVSARLVTRWVRKAASSA